MKLKLPHLKYNKTITGIAIGALFASSFFYAGWQYRQKTLPVRLPANQACLQYAKTISKALTTSQNKLVAVVENKPEPQTDYTEIKKQLKDCTFQADKYQISLGGK